MLDVIYAKQAELSERYTRQRGLATPEELVRHPITGKPMDGMVAWTLQLVTCIDDELAEIRGWLPWKHWKNYDDGVNWHEVDKEMIDILHFVEQYFVLRGMGPEEQLALYLSKNAENHARQDGVVAGREDYKEAVQ